MKICRVCKEEKNPGDFHRLKDSRDGLQPDCKACRKIFMAQWYSKNRERRLRDESARYRSKQGYRVELRRETMDAYGGKCSCCGEAELEFLTIDHINNDGYVNRDKEGRGAYLWGNLKKLGFPKDNYRCLCWNCNCSRAKHPSRICVHERKKLNG